MVCRAILGFGKVAGGAKAIDGRRRGTFQASCHLGRQETQENTESPIPASKWESSLNHKGSRTLCNENVLLQVVRLFGKCLSWPVLVASF